MKRIYKTTLVILLGTCLAFGVYWSKALAGGDSVEMTVNDFCEALNKGNEEKIKSFLINVPNYIQDRNRVEFSKWRDRLEIELVKEEEKNGVIIKQKEDCKNCVNTTQPIKYATYTTDELLKNVRIRSNNGAEQALEILETIQKEDEARVNIKIEDKSNRFTYPVIFYELLLYKEEDGWKIFCTRLSRATPLEPSQWEDYSFYAK